QPCTVDRDYDRVVGYGKVNHVSGMEVSIRNGTVTDYVISGLSERSATQNRVTISGGTVKGDVYSGYGGDGNSFPGQGHATQNRVTISGGTVEGIVYGGYSETGDDAVSDNTLEVAGKNLELGGVRNFENITFTLPDTFDITADTALNITRVPVDLTGVNITVSSSIAALKPGDTLTLISNAGGTLKNTSSGTFALSISGGALIATVKNSYTVTGAANPTTGGALVCTSPVQHGKGTTCTVTANTGYTFDKTAVVDPAGKATVTCTDTECAVSDVTGDVTVAGVFKLRPAAGSTTTAVPTMSEIGLLLSGLALAGAAAPALRRRERKARKQD
ncbi:MAG: IPTL-CTERM sorting domain-containing protein, partial [Ottowia sp.]|nr:IPTL-CTERM sorting domain-containing protein [Ottowia sp.]